MIRSVFIGACGPLADLIEARDFSTLTELQDAVKFESDSFLDSKSTQASVFAKSIADLYSQHLAPTVASSILNDTGDVLYVFLDMVDVTVKEKFQYLTQTPRIH